MKKRMLLLGIGLAVVGTGMIVKKLRNKKNNEVEEIKEDNIVTEEVAIDEEEPIIIDVEDVEVVDDNDTQNEFEQRSWFRRKIVRPVLIVVTYLSLLTYKNYKIIKNEVDTNKAINKRNRQIVNKLRYDFKKYNE